MRRASFLAVFMCKFQIPVIQLQNGKICGRAFRPGFRNRSIHQDEKNVLLILMDPQWLSRGLFGSFFRSIQKRNWGLG